MSRVLLSCSCLALPLPCAVKNQIFTGRAGPGSDPGLWDQRPSLLDRDLCPRPWAWCSARSLPRPSHLIIATGDYLCAWPHEQAKAPGAARDVDGTLPGRDLEKSVIALGNHEVGHHQILRSGQTATTPQGFAEILGVRVVWLPSDADLAHVLTRDWLDQALTFPGRLVVVRHEPWGALGARGRMDPRPVRAASPTLVLHGTFTRGPFRARS